MYMDSKYVFSSFLKINWNIVSALLLTSPLLLLLLGFGGVFVGFFFLFPEKLNMQHSECIPSLLCCLLYITPGSRIPWCSGKG